ncbi:ankyrin repeat domain-containing protein [Bradyrhizobium sp. STM 3809]|uniref:ankyrin repeat domain-containing protein n=1 Tax=Bradyrhizobium sp. STM 3809 TaxID=551936 RepID=UPI001F0AFB26|nr:ankyrin repeat domain-containing protein [Bradyrhizobium sp. STM 3809]
MVWDGVRCAEQLRQQAALVRHSLADAAKTGDWAQVFDVLSAHSDLVNVTRLDGPSLYAPLHQAAHGGAPVAIAQRLIDMGAWRTLQNARGERPVDVAERRGHRQLLDILAPRCKHSVPLGILLRIQGLFHDVIRGRIVREFKLPEQELRLPELEPLLELDLPEMWFPVPGMYGGFRFRIDQTGVNATLISESWSRVVDGSGHRHLITSEGTKLVEEGFV